MADDSFIAYVGLPDFHDGKIKGVTHRKRAVSVEIIGASGRQYVVEFIDADRVSMNHPDGMILYAISEMHAVPPYRRFVFVNWNDEDTAFLEIIANDFFIKSE